MIRHPDWRSRAVSPDEVLAHLPSGPRAFVHGRTLREREEALIAIAHPDFRGELTRTFRGIRHFPL